jgi:glycopeptide antibiotics resistance protein
VRKRPTRHRIVLAAVVVGILAFTMPPGGGENEIQQLPFGEISSVVTHPGNIGDTLDVLGNVLLFLPLGAALAYATGLTLRRATVAGALFSACIEMVQLVIPGRWTSVDDFMLNTCGTALGYLAWRALSRRNSEPSLY